jgi:hypothetical protein
MKEVERECLDHDADEIEHCVEADDDDAIACDEPNMPLKDKFWIWRNYFCLQIKLICILYK